MNILGIESTIEVEVLLTTEEATSQPPNSGASYHVTPFLSQFRQYVEQDLKLVHVENSQHCVVIGIGTVELNILGDSTLVLVFMMYDMFPNLADH